MARKERHEKGPHRTSKSKKERVIWNQKLTEQINELDETEKTMTIENLNNVVILKWKSLKRAENSQWLIGL